MDSTPWYQSRAAIMAYVGVALLAVAGGFVIFRSSIFVRNPDAEAHYNELERHRAQQRATPVETQPTSAAAPVAPETAAPAAATPNTPTAGTASATTAAKPARNYWTAFRGPHGNGIYDEVAIRTQWPSTGLPLLWKQPVGGGYASFVVAGGRAYTIEQRRRQEVVATYDLETGREIWTHGWDAEFIESMGGDGPRATPTWDDGRIYALGATGELRCLDAATGKQIWGRNILSDNRASNLEWGMSGAPLIVDDKVIVQPGGSPGRSVVAYNKLTGEPVWRALDDRQAYVSPMLVTLGGARQILVVSSNRVVGLTPENGSLLWEYPWNTSMGINCSQPIVVDANRFFISSGYGKGAALVEVKKDGGGFAARTVWENTMMKNKFNNSVLYNGHVYGLDEGILTCIDVETGQRKWKGGRYGYGQLLLADGHLIVLSDTGELALVKASPDQHTEVAKFSALEGKTWNHPAIADGRLLVRNATQMACFNLAAQ